jgi:predicted O-methyltransferase YrrM
MKFFLRWFRDVRRLERRVAEFEREIAQHRAEAAEWMKLYPPGHFYSPLPSTAEVAEAYERGGFGPPFAGIDLREPEQLALLDTFAGFYREQPFPEKPAEGWRYYLNNPSYGHFDGITLYSMLRHLQPRRIIEVGSGFSSAAMLDLNQHVFGGRMALTFIDPDMARLRQLLRPDDASRVTLIEKRVQEVPLEAFDALEANDVLFVDSSHVAKIGSDVNRLFFDVFPRLRAGVHIHIHDVSGFLEYPREWFEEGRAWNEQYVLRAFLMFNRAFEVVMFTRFLFHFHQAFFRERMPLCARGGGGQMWLRKTE